jgi:hypothetical protein
MMMSASSPSSSPKAKPPIIVLVLVLDLSVIFTDHCPIDPQKIRERGTTTIVGDLRIARVE